MGIFTDDFEASTKKIEIVTDRYNDSIKVIIKHLNDYSDRPIGEINDF